MITEIEQKIQDYQERIRRGEYPKIGNAAAIVGKRSNSNYMITGKESCG